MSLCAKNNHLRTLATVRRRAAFTLIELLAVIAILGVALLVVTVSFQGVGQASKVRTSAAQMRTIFSLARQWAITHNEKVSVVLPTSHSHGGLSKRYQAFSVYSTTKGYLRDWNVLPDGVMFDPNIDTSKNPFNSGNDGFVTLPYPTSSSGNASLPCITFKPDGSVTPSKQYELYIREGTDGVVRTNSITASIDVYPLTGQFRVRDYGNL